MFVPTRPRNLFCVSVMASLLAAEAATARVALSGQRGRVEVFGGIPDTEIEWNDSSSFATNPDEDLTPTAAISRGGENQPGESAESDGRIDVLATLIEGTGQLRSGHVTGFASADIGPLIGPSGPGGAGTGSEYALAFNVDEQGARIRLFGSLTSERGFAGSSLQINSETNGSGTVFFELPDDTNPGTRQFDQTVDLAEGFYALIPRSGARAGEGSFPSSSAASFDVSYAFRDIAANPIPLPPAVWSGLCGIGFAIALVRVRWAKAPQ